ncbi:GxxExxY protein [Epilithonimonas hungarica]|uniref:GxxExxY protein n=1 Tax=Epilithonimonas hungarica TaxID=454006 RepID=UPI002783E5D1|nr:GxxExxY protein [Epilithonimonas hungarica]MDP9954660.1 GxxExxY protein [Epilithonimonas hungarica]
MNQKQITELTYKILGACIEVHKNLGSDLLESVYHKALKEEFRIQNINFKSEFVISVQYKGIDLDCGFQCDFLIEDLIIVEIKSVSEFHDLHKAQILNYMNLLKVPKGILVNFNVTNIFKEGQKTFVNKYYEQLN